MSRQRSKLHQQKTLGFFSQGIPVVFLEIGSIFGQNPDVLEYRDFYVAHEGQGQDPGLTPALCQGYERSVTALHEIRHFHDALLCRPLFELFLLRNEISWSIAQLIRSLPQDMDRIPINWSDARLTEDHQARLFRELIFAADDAYFSRFEQLNESSMCLGHEINLDYLVETNAIVTELLQLYKTLGIRSMRDYYGHVVSHLKDPTYTFLLARFCELYGDLVPAVVALYVVIPFCLYSSSNPTLAFCKLMEECKANPNGVHHVCNAATLKRCFRDEGELEQRILDTRLYTSDGPVHIEFDKLPDGEFAQALIEFHRTMYDCRKKLIDRYIGEFNYQPGTYYERFYELPVPPILFYPDVSAHGEVKGIHEEEFRKRGELIYKIAAYPGETPGGDIIFAGLTTLADTKPAIRFEIADIQLAYWYFYNASFRGKTAVYTRMVDHMYERTLREFGRDSS